MLAATSAVVEGGTIQYQFTRTGGDLSSPFSFNWDYNPPLPLGAAAPGVDFIEPATKTITFAAGQTVATLDFVTIADNVYEGPLVGPSTEAFAITFVPSPTYTFTVVSNIATIVDGDLPAPLPTISVSQTDAQPTPFGNLVNEGDDMTSAFTRTGNTASELTVEFHISSSAFGSAKLGSDFDFLPDYAGAACAKSLSSGRMGSPTTLKIGSVTFEAGSSTATVTFSTVEDELAENPPGGFETFSFGTGPVTPTRSPDRLRKFERPGQDRRYLHGLEVLLQLANLEASPSGGASSFPKGQSLPAD